MEGRLQALQADSESLKHEQKELPGALDTQNQNLLDAAFREVKSELKRQIAAVEKKGKAWSKTQNDAISEFGKTVVKATKDYAKRQMTWFRAEERVEWVHMDAGTSVENVVRSVAGIFRARDMVAGERESAA